MNGKPLDPTTDDYSYMIFGDSPLLDGNKELNNVNDLPSFHEELHQAANSHKLQPPQPDLSVVTPLPSINHNNLPATSNFSNESITQHGSSKDLSLLPPLTHTSSPNVPAIFNVEEYAKEKNGQIKDSKKHTSLRPISIAPTIDEIIPCKSNSQLIENCSTLKPMTCPPLLVTTTDTSETKSQSDQPNTHLINFHNTKMSSDYQVCQNLTPTLKNTTLGFKEDTYKSLKANHKVTSILNFSAEKIPSSQYEDPSSPNFSQIHLSSNKDALFSNHPNFDCCTDSNQNNDIVFPANLSEETNTSFDHTQLFKSEPCFEKKGVFDFDKDEKISTDAKTKQTSTHQLPSQEINQVHNHLLTISHLLPLENKTQDEVQPDPPRSSCNVFNFDSNCSMKSRRSSLHFEGIPKADNSILFKNNPKVDCFNRLIQSQDTGQSEDAIQDSSDIFEHIMSKQSDIPTVANTSSNNTKTNIYSRQENSGDGLESLNIEHVNDNSLSSIEINEKLSADFLNKETNLNLYTTNLTEYINTNSQFNEPSLENVRPSIKSVNSMRPHQDEDTTSHFNIVEVIQRQSPCRETSITMRNQMENLDFRNVCEKNLNILEPNDPEIIFSKNVSNLNTLVEKAVTKTKECEISAIISTMDVHMKEKSVEKSNNDMSTDTYNTNADTSDIDTSDLNNIILNNEIFGLDTKNQSIQSIKETYKIEEENANLMIDNHVDSFVKHIFQEPPAPGLKDEVPQKHSFTNEPSVQPNDGQVVEIELIESNPTKTPSDSNEVLKFGNQMLEHNELHSMVDINEHLHAEHVEMEINDLFGTESHFIPDNGENRLKERVDEEHESINSGGSIKEINSNHTELSPTLKKDSLHFKQQSSSLKKKKIENVKKKIRGKCVSKDISSLPSPQMSTKSNVCGTLFSNNVRTIDTLLTNIEVPNDLETRICSPHESGITILSQTGNGFQSNKKQLTESSQDPECVTISDSNYDVMETKTEHMEIFDTLKKSRKRPVPKQYVEDMPAKKAKTEDNSDNSTNMFVKKLPEVCCSNDFSEKSSSGSTSKSKKEQALNKLKLILITNKDVNLNNELISVNEDEVLHDSHDMDESEVKVLNIENTRKSLLDNSKLMDEDNETLMGSQILENIEMFSNLSEYFNIDQNGELNQEMNHEENGERFISSLKDPPEVMTLGSISAEDNINKSKSPVENNKVKKISQKKKVLKPKSNVANMNVSENVTSTIKKKNTKLKTLKNISTVKTLEIDGGVTVKETGKKPQIIKQIFCKSSNKTNKSSIQKSTSQSIETQKKDDFLDDNTIKTVDKSEKYFKKDFQIKPFTENIAVKKENEQAKNMKPKPIHSRNRSHSLDSNLMNMKIKQSIKTMPPFTKEKLPEETLDDSLFAPSESPITSMKDFISKARQNDTKKRSHVKTAVPLTNNIAFTDKPITLNQLAQGTTERDAKNGMPILQNKSENTSMKTKRKSSCIEMPTATIELQQTTQEREPKVIKTKTTKAKSRKPRKKDTNEKPIEVPLQSKADQTISNETSIEKTSLTSSEHSKRSLEVVTRKDMECQTDGQIETELFIINELPSPRMDCSITESILDGYANTKYLGKSMTENFVVLNKSFSRVQINKGSVAFSADENKNKIDSNNLNQIEEITHSKNDLKESKLPPFTSALNSFEDNIISTEEYKDISEDSIDDNILEIQTYPDSNNATGIFLDNKPLRSDNFEKKFSLNQISNKKVVPSRKTSHLENNEIRHLNPEINMNSTLNDSVSSVQSLKKKPKYIIMKIDGENKVYKLMDDSFEKELPVTDKISSKKVLPSKSKQLINNSISIQKTNSKPICQQKELINQQCNEVLDHSISLSKKKSTDEFNLKPNLAQIKAIQSIKTAQQPFENNTNIPNRSITNSIATEDRRGLLKGKSAIKELINKINAMKKKQTQLLVNANLESVKKKEHYSQNQAINNNIPNRVTNNNVKEKDIQTSNKNIQEKDVNAISEEAQSVTPSAQLNKKTPTVSKALPQTKTFNLPIKNKIVRIVPMYPNKPQGSRRNSLDENLLKKVGINNNVLPLKQIRQELKGALQGNKVQKEESKSLEINTTNDVQTIVINKNEKDATKSLLETNKLILDILNKNKIKTIILGCKNKEIFRKDLNSTETDIIKHGIQNLTSENVNPVEDPSKQNNLTYYRTLQNVSKNENISLNKVNTTVEHQEKVFSIGNKTIRCNIKESAQNKTETIVGHIGKLLGTGRSGGNIQTTCGTNGQTTEIIKGAHIGRHNEREPIRADGNLVGSKKEVGGAIGKLVNGQVIVEQNQATVRVLKDNHIDQIGDERSGTVDRIMENGRVERHIQHSGESINQALGPVDSRTSNKKNAQKIHVATENEGVERALDSLCDVIQVFQCRLCVFKSHEKQSFVHHLKSSHDKKASPYTEEFELDVVSRKHGEPDREMAGECGGPPEMEQSTVGTGEIEQQTTGACSQTLGTNETKRGDKVSRQKIAPIDDIAEFNSWLVDPICDLKPFRCNLSSCSVRLSSQSSLDVHSVCHRPDEGFKCYDQSCSETFTKWGPCKSHLLDAHGIQMDLISCPVPACAYLCSTRSQLGSHLKHHARVNKRHACDACDAVYRTRAMLTRHVNSAHAKKRKQKPEGDRWYAMKQCLLCLRTYSDIKCLKKHIREVHKRLKPFQCAVCGFSTGRKATLQLHVRQHTQEKPYACDKCEFRTGDHNILRKHLQRHMPVKKYQCTFETCSYSCTEPYRLKSHLASKHKPRFLDELSEKLNIVTIPADVEGETEDEETEEGAEKTVTLPSGPEESTIFYYTVH